MVLEVFNTKANHICTVLEKTSMSLLPPLKENANCCRRFGRYMKKLILITERNPRTTEFYRSYTEILQTRRKQIKSGSLIIHPFSFFRAFYEMWLIEFFALCLIYMPLRAAFNVPIRPSVELFLFFVCLVDIIMNFFTGYVDPKRKQIVMAPRKIARHYLLSVHFITDVLSSFPNVFTNNEDLSFVIGLLSFLKITRLHSLYFYIECTTEFFQKKTLFYRVLKFPILTFLIIHWFTCIYFIEPTFRKRITGAYHPKSWVILDEILPLDLDIQYLRTFYMASSGLLCIVSGHETYPWEEQALRIFTYVFGRIFFLFLSVMIVNVLIGIQVLETKYFETISQLKSFMRLRKLPAETRNKLLQYYKYKYRNKFFKENVITGLLSDKLKKEINMDKCRRLVETVSIFQKLNPKTLEDVLSQLRAEIFLPNDMIISAGTLGECMYFLSSGTVCVSTPLGKEVCHLQDGAYFGEIALLYKGKKRTANIVAIEFCEVYKLERKAFRHIFLKHPDVLKNIEELVQTRLKVTEEIDRQEQLVLSAEEANKRE